LLRARGRMRSSETPIDVEETVRAVVDRIRAGESRVTYSVDASEGLGGIERSGNAGACIVNPGSGLGRRPLRALEMQSRLRAAMGVNLLTTHGRPHAQHARRRGYSKHYGLRWSVVTIVSTLALALGVWMFRENISPPVSRLGRAYTTGIGERATVTLADGSRVILAPQTRLMIDQTFGKRSRHVTLEGEAYFTVAASAHTPFLVRTGKVVTRVLGTRFDVRRYAREITTRITVVDGRVAVHWTANPHAVTVLNAKMVGFIHDSGTARVIREGPVDDYTAWVTGRLVFTDAPVSEIVAELDRVYSVKMRVTDTKLATRKVTWTLHPTKLSMGDAMNALANILDAHIVQTDSVLTLMPGRVATPKPVFPHSPFTMEPFYGR
jgi:transmembrane sensor